jgi:hypothetical protein
MDKATRHANIGKLFITIFLVLCLFSSLSNNYTNAQHHGAPPPLAKLGDRNIKMNFILEPTVIGSGQNALIKMSLTDEKTGQKIQHVTYRMTLSKNNQIKISDFFHSHQGDITIASKNTNSPNVRVEGTFDALTNAVIADPSGTIAIIGPVFSEKGLYKADIEIITIDNDKTDLQNPLEYQFDITVK